MARSRVEQHLRDLEQQTLLLVKHLLHISEVLLVLDLVGVRLAQQGVIDDFQVVLPLLSRQQVQTVEVLQVIKEVG